MEPRARKILAHLFGLAPLPGSTHAVARDVRPKDDGVTHHPVDGRSVGEDELPLRED